MRDGQKGTRGILIFCIAAMGLHLMGQGFSALRENGWEKGKALAAAACLQAGEQAMALYLPGTVYEEPQGTLLQEIQASARGQLPYFSFAQSQEPKERVVEDDTTIQAMIQENERRSEIPAIFRACSGVEMPKPMAQGMSVFWRTTSTMEVKSVLISLLVPVTPRLETR